MKWCREVTGGVGEVVTCGGYLKELKNICWKLVYFLLNIYSPCLECVTWNTRYENTTRYGPGVGVVEQNENPQHLEMKSYSLVTNWEIRSYLVPFWYHSHRWTVSPMGAHPGNLFPACLAPATFPAPCNSVVCSAHTHSTRCSVQLRSWLPREHALRLESAYRLRTPVAFWFSDCFFHLFSEESV